ncbi:MAG: hypothetical protein ACOY3E_01180 [Pseudomonadota bacterium]
MSLRLLVLLLVAITTGCAATSPPTGPRLRTSHDATPQRLTTGEKVLVCLSGLMLEIAVDNAVTDDDDHPADSDEDRPVAELVCESAQLPH